VPKKIALCTTCKGRTQHLERTLPQNILDNEDCADCVFVVLNYNSGDHLLDYLETVHANDIARGRLAVYSYFDAPVFKMAHAKNMAHRCGILEGAEVLVNVDADNFTSKGFASYVQQRFEEDEIFLWSKMVKSGPDRLPRGISGRIAVSKEAFLNVGGYDEKYATWGPDDKDFNTRLRNLGYSAHEIDKKYLGGILHTDKMRFHEYPQAADNDGQQFEEVKYSHATVTNYGNVGAGAVLKSVAQFG
jgi:hypothetical protein